MVGLEGKKYKLVRQRYLKNGKIGFCDLVGWKKKEGVMSWEFEV